MNQKIYVFPTSFAQERLWVLDQIEPGNPAYNIPAAVRLAGNLSIEALDQVISEIVRRHEILRTVFTETDGHPEQVIIPSLAIRLSLVTLDIFEPGEKEREARKLAEIEARRSFDLKRGPLIRVIVLKLSDEDHILLMTMHHIISDGWSSGVLAREISILYESMVEGTPSTLPDLSLQYVDFTVWQHDLFSKGVFDEQIEFWKQQLAGSSGILQFPYDHQRPLICSYKGVTERTLLSREWIEQLKAFSHKQKVTLFVTLLGIFNILLHRYSGQEDINVGVPVASRNEEEIEHLIGCFINILVIRTDLSANPDFCELCKMINERTVTAYAHQDIPFKQIVEVIQPGREPGITPLYQVMMTLQEAPVQKLRLPGIDLLPFEVDSNTAELDLLMSLDEKEYEIELSLQYSLDLFEDTTIKRLIANFKTLLESIIQNHNRPVKSLPLLSFSEYQQIIIDLNSTIADYSRYLCVHEKFNQQVEQTPDSIATIFEDQYLTYSVLKARSNQLGHYLKAFGVGPDIIVGICVERSIEFIISILGVMKAGGAYLPLDIAYPVDRIIFMLEDSGANMLLTRKNIIEALPDPRIKTIFLDNDSKDWERVLNQFEFNPISLTTPENLVYVIYTSGSTGKPKGTMIQHGTLVSYIETVVKDYGIVPEDRVLQFCSVSFDNSAEEIYPCLMTGATLVMRTDWMLESVPRFLEVCEQWKITMLSLPTSYWHEITAALGNEVLTLPDSLRLMIIAGERALPERLSRWYEFSGGGARLLNTYGLTESTILSTLIDLTKPPQTRVEIKEVSIGRPINNSRIYILNSDSQPQPINSIGEIYIGGSLLARGYFNRPYETAGRFLPDHLSNEVGSRVYRTGDLARFLPDGLIEFHGRNDQQIKIRGYRVELGEIESELVRNHNLPNPPLLKDAVVIVVNDSINGKRLIAYIVSKDHRTISSIELRGSLKRRLPDYMIPSSFVSLDSLPLTPNGKVDRVALAANSQFHPLTEIEYAPPRTDLERITTQAWEEVLQKSNIGIDHNFFDLGGHSLLLIKLRGKLQGSLGKELAMVDLFKYPTIRSFVEYLEEKNHRSMRFVDSFDKEQLLMNARESRRNRRQRRQGATGEQS